MLHSGSSASLVAYQTKLSSACSSIPSVWISRSSSLAHQLPNGIYPGDEVSRRRQQADHDIGFSRHVEKIARLGNHSKLIQQRQAPFFLASGMRKLQDDGPSAFDGQSLSARPMQQVIDSG